MRTYLFGDIQKTLKKNTFELEEIVKDAVGASEKNEQRVLAIQKEYIALTKELSEKPNKKRREQITDKLTKINDEVTKLTELIHWSHKFDTCLSVMDILLVEGSAGLTKQNFGRFDAEQVWRDFFTAPTQSEEN